jgi:hypothetical protein
MYLYVTVVDTGILLKKKTFEDVKLKGNCNVPQIPTKFHICKRGPDTGRYGSEKNPAMQTDTARKKNTVAGSHRSTTHALEL